jgi:hypothetical protein
MQDAVREASFLMSVFKLLEAVTFLCILLHAFGAANKIPTMAVILKALTQCLASLSTLAAVVLILLVLTAWVLLVSDPQDERLTRIDLMSGYMFTNFVAGMSLLTLCHCVAPSDQHHLFGWTRGVMLVIQSSDQT